MGTGNLGAIYHTRGELDRAEEMHKKALATARPGADDPLSGQDDGKHDACRPLRRVSPT